MIRKELFKVDLAYNLCCLVQSDFRSVWKGFVSQYNAWKCWPQRHSVSTNVSYSLFTRPSNLSKHRSVSTKLSHMFTAENGNHLITWKMALENYLKNVSHVYSWEWKSLDVYIFYVSFSVKKFRMGAFFFPS